MKAPGETRRARGIAPLCAALLALGAPSPALLAQSAGAPAGGTERPPEVLALASCRWSSAIRWVGATRVGLLHVLAADSLFTFDLLDGGRMLGRPVRLPADFEGPLLLPIPASDLVVVPRARSGLSGAAGTSHPPGRAAGDTLSSYGIDALTGRIAWERAPLPRRPALVYLPEAGVLLVIETKESVVKAVDAASGDVLWRIAAEAWRVHPRGGYVDVIGQQSRLLDARTGRTVLTYALPVGRSEDLAALSSPDRIVVRAGKAVLGYRLPPLPEPARDTAAVLPAREAPVRAAWTQDVQAGYDCLRDARPPLPRDLVLIHSRSGTQLLDGATGRPLWQDRAGSAQVTVSPDLRNAAVLTRDRLALVDLESGAAQVQSAKSPCRDMEGSVRALRWLDGDQVLLCCAERADRMIGVSVVSRSRQERLWWNRVTFPQASYRATSDEKVLSTLKGVSAGVGLVGMVGPIVLAPYSVASATSLAQLSATLGAMEQIHSASSIFLAASGLVFKVIESRASLRPHDQIQVWPFADDQVGIAPTTTTPAFADRMAALAWRRYQARSDSMPSSQGSRAGIAGQEDAYRIVEQDFLAPAERTLATYHRKSVNGMGLLEPYPIAVSVEDDERTLRILSTTGREPSPAATDLLPPAGRGGASPE